MKIDLLAQVVRARAICVVIGASLGFGGPAPFADESNSPGTSKVAPGGVGAVRFPVSTTPATQEQFNRAVAMLHSFWYEEVDKAFSGIGEKDPRCGMAYWGVAMSLYHPLWRPPDEATLRRGWAAVQQAKAVGGQTQRERDYIDAIEVFYQDWDKTDHKTRALAYSKAMEQLHRNYSDDREAAIFYALSLLGTAPPTDKTYANQKKAAEILNRISLEQPDHPGVIHYIIHAYDAPALAHLGLLAARRYAKIAPAVPHALHMPSHIFTRLGLWQESIQSNQDCVAASKEYARRIQLDGVWDEQLHAMDYLAYAYLQGAEDKKAKEIMDELNRIHKSSSEELKVAYSMAAIPARYALERRRWTDAAVLSAGWRDFPWDRYPAAEAIVHFARGLGAARGNDIAGARNELKQLEAIPARLAQANQPDWATPTEVARREVAAWVARSEGKHEEAIRLLGTAADLEDSTEKQPVTPGPVLPARELLADLLLDLGRSVEALKEFEASLRNAPNRFNSLFGAARAAELSGDREKAGKFYAQLVAVCARADSDRQELTAAKRFVEKRSP
jgi:tetratricopeptide (TPR) repeat protein